MNKLNDAFSSLPLSSMTRQQILAEMEELTAERTLRRERISQSQYGSRSQYGEYDADGVR